MTETRKPPRCHYDRALGDRVASEHRDDCPHELGTGDCPAAGRGCAPCTAPHCLVCGREHATNAQPDTCPECIGKVRGDLVELAADYALLALEAIAGGHDGQLVAAAPIPGGTAAVLHGPTVRFDQLRTGRGYGLEELREMHPVGRTGRPSDPVPPLAVLAQWEDLYRAWFGHARGGRSTVAGACRYLVDQLDHMANGPAVHEGPDWLAFTKSVRGLRAGLERALHDEQEPERGVECFECGDQLVRRFRDPKRCRHRTPARAELERALIRQRDAQDWLRTLGSYPELDPVERDLAAARGPSASLVAAAKQPCAKCQDKQGGLDDPRAGQSWECPGCRKAYDVGEYVTAVRRDLIEDGDGWTQVTIAAQAATDLVGMVVPDGLVRKWADRLKVRSVCAWREPVKGRAQRYPLRLVFWPDVAEEANAAVDRMLQRRHRVEQITAWTKAVDAGGNPEKAAAKIGIGAQQLRALLEAREELAERWRRGVDRGEKPERAAERLGISRAWLRQLLGTVAA